MALIADGDRDGGIVESISYYHSMWSRTSIGQLHYDGVWLQLPEFISVLLCYLKLSIPLRIKEQKP